MKLLRDISLLMLVQIALAVVFSIIDDSQKPGACVDPHDPDPASPLALLPGSVFIRAPFGHLCTLLIAQFGGAAFVLGRAQNSRQVLWLSLGLAATVLAAFLYAWSSSYTGGLPLQC